ncbi:ABC-2 family transporter protein [Lactobacillus kefiranofaciens]|uniref:ABC transporter permease n=1 Tax=Lactobacillus kefiranofaciens TaxID=267818 RepID=UPI0023EC6AD9|nr:ABC-2 family transporter protein [Lactobacillus kefiranofaciens]MDF4142069.1 ABC-2 family transporter protein [Lactobacillus kefiranofaciens]MDH5101291.1 ABC-2 family transporter protein [Lactobacillus kefiranofaciens]
MKINRSIARLSLKSALCNKSSIVILLLQSIVPVLVMFYLWSGILNGNKKIGGLTNSQMIIYYIGVNFVNFFIWYAIDWELNTDIHSGKISNILHRPISVQRYYFNKMIGDRVANIVVLLPVFVIGLIYLTLVKQIKINLINGAFFIISLILTTILWFLFSFIIGCLAFWFENLFFVLLVKDVLVSLLAGYYFPLSLFPKFWQRLVEMLPFKYFSNYPINIILNNNSINNWIENTIIELGWILILYIALLEVVKKGLKKYADIMG